MTAHTPGPWSVYEDANKVAAHGSRNLVRSSALGDYYTESLTDERGEFFNPADARLIAAAPELLEALRAAYSDIQRLPGHTIDMLGRIEAAIAKATGAASPLPS